MQGGGHEQGNIQNSSPGYNINEHRRNNWKPSRELAHPTPTAREDNALAALRMMFRQHRNWEA
ncbi:uncharacterized protein K489DRAFT_378814 [Dissoconium aciculare CBS 342.82]|uniref:Uncharacterized protein n=1 Tax=Dissoconium aciculare CBS 342.82 TaxID=1314786 RepID=A0A6J3M8S1_9PEZI|nr:uncharacterized protein K489DRAFT_378814 [Dissoconium aciculare CBS 342.82]KAF1824395.1 hypothetical protein K489DRAFT_378814 [Dissoconium aciculare CBS 342.82]